VVIQSSDKIEFKVGTPKTVPCLKLPSSLRVHLENQYVCKLKKWFKNIYQKTLILHKFCIWYSNGALFGALESPFACQLETMKLWPI